LRVVERRPPRPPERSDNQMQRFDFGGRGRPPLHSFVIEAQ